MPEAPEYPQYESSEERTRALLQPGQRKAAPARFFKEWAASKEDKDVGHQVAQYKGESWDAKGCNGSWQDQDAEEKQGWDTKENKQVPLGIHSPKDIAAQQAEHTWSPFGNGRHDECCERWPK